MERVAIYLAGNIKKGHEENEQDFWGETELKKITTVLAPIHVDFLHPAIRNDDLSDPKSSFGRDITQVYCSHVVFVDARERRGLGVGAEMLWAKMNKIPVVTLCPPETHYRKSQAEILNTTVCNWVHPFIGSLSDRIVTTVEEGAQWIHLFIVRKESKLKIKGPDFIKDAMAYYRKTQFDLDDPMRLLVNQNDDISARMGEAVA